MNQKKDFSGLQRQVTARISASVDQHDPVDALLAELRNIYSQAEALLLLNSENSSHIACQAGCSHCCVVNVSISLLEGLAIVNFLQQLQGAECDAIVFSLDRLWTRIRGLDDDERLAQKQKCAFLNESGCCSIYPVRPLFCRGLTSTDPEACQLAVVCKLHGETQPILMHQYQKQLYETFYLGISDGLNQAGLDGRSFQMTGLVRYLQKKKDTSRVLFRQQKLCWEELYA